MAKRRCKRCKKWLPAKSGAKLCQKCRHKRKIERAHGKKKVNKGDAIRNLKFCHEYLVAHPCVDCGITDIVVLQFDHVRGKKRGNVSSMARAGVSLSTLNTEIAKCEIRCANCHIRKTAREQGWFKAKNEGIDI